MISSLYVLSPTGSCTEKIDLRDIKATENSCGSDPQLLSGLFTALISFAQLTTGLDNQLNYLPIKNLTYYFYLVNGGGYFVLETESENNSMVLEEYLEMLKDFSLLDESELDCAGIKIIISRYIRRALFKKPANLAVSG